MAIANWLKNPPMIHRSYIGIMMGYQKHLILIIILVGLCPMEVAPVFFGGRLIGLDKKSGDIRSIVIGMTLRRLASKCANTAGVTRSTISIF